ncbi:GIY-YIG nuclease family protein [Lederbergia citri]|uniref:GIY-YIG homing endonuclease n=1 Tax=Lederbergia citri TaxID=2833580 RepID=A0A942YEW1_9BACI|nr:hypothetical protein [Lederbergia citri]MBS4194343.1 hypothetical protein [Lederbergia citri]
MIEINGKKYKTYEFDEIDREKYAGFIYVTVDETNGMMYVGQHTLWNRNYYGSGTYFLRAVQKRGIENFSRYIIFIEETQEDLDEKEIFYISQGFGIDTVKSSKWYNIRYGARGGDITKGMTEEDYEKWKKRQSEAAKARDDLEETTRRLVAINSKPVVVFYNGQLYKEFPSTGALARDLQKVYNRKSLMSTWETCKIIVNGGNTDFTWAEGWIGIFKLEFEALLKNGYSIEEIHSKLQKNRPIKKRPGRGRPKKDKTEKEYQKLQQKEA